MRPAHPHRAGSRSTLPCGAPGTAGRRCGTGWTMRAGPAGPRLCWQAATGRPLQAPRHTRSSRVGHDRSRKHPGITGCAGAPPCRGQHPGLSRRAHAANRDDLITPLLDLPHHTGIIGPVTDNDHRDYFGSRRPSHRGPSPHPPLTWMIPVTRRWMTGIYVQPEHSDGLLVIPSRHHASHDKRGWPGNRQTFKNTTTAMFSTRLNTAITAGRNKTPRPASSPIQNTGLFASAVTAGRPHRANHPIRSRCSASTSGQDGWSRSTTSSRPMSGMGSPYSSPTSASSGTGGPYS